MKVEHKRHRKGQLKMRGLADGIRRFYDACSSVRGAVARGATLELEHIDTVINALDCALVCVRTLDLDVFERSDPTEYHKLRSASAAGSTVLGLIAPRNMAVHHVDVIDPDIVRAVGPLDGGSFIIFPKWKPRAQLPHAMFQYHDGNKKGQDIVDAITSYDAGVAGRLVLDTLFDAYAFFNHCDGTLADRDGNGKLVGVNLPPLPVATGYVRLAPDQPTHEEVDQQIRARAQSAAPAGQSREITGCLDTPAGPVLCGSTTVDSYRTQSFTESIQQVVHDLEMGFPYRATFQGEATPLTFRDGALMAADVPLLDRLQVLSANDREPWAGRWDLCIQDAAYYRDQRRPL